MSAATRGGRHWVWFLLLPLCTLHAEMLEDAPGRYAVDIARPIKRELTQNETDSGIVVICDMFHSGGDTLQWITYSDYPIGTMAERDSTRIYDRWPKGEAATRHGRLRNSVVHRLGDTVGREFIIDLAPEKKVLRARIYIVGDRTYQISYTGPAGSEDSPAAQHFLDSFRLTP